MKVNRRRMLMFSGGFFVFIALYLAWPRTAQVAVPVKSAGPDKAHYQNPAKPLASKESSPSETSRLSTPSADPDPQKAPAEIIKSIENLSVQYVPENVPLIGTYLSHPDKTVREAALQGLVILGESSASPVIQKAAQNLQDPAEAQTFKEAADYLALPSDSEMNQ